MKLWSGKYEGVTAPAGWQEVDYWNNRFAGLSKPKDVPLVDVTALHRNLATVCGRFGNADKRPLIFEVEGIDDPAFNIGRQMLHSICAPTLDRLGLDWGVFDQMGGTHSLNAFLDPMHPERRSVFARAASVSRIGNVCFTPHYMRTAWLRPLEATGDPVRAWRQSIRSKIECCRAAGYERVCLTLTPYMATDLAQAVKEMRETTAGGSPLLTVEMLREFYIGDDLLKAGLDECLTYGDGVNIWTFRSEPDDAVLRLLEAV